MTYFRRHFGSHKEVYGTERLVQQIFTFEELTTIMCQIESCLNSRPLCPLVDDPNSIAALTAAHFLVIGSLLAHPQRETGNMGLTKRRKICQSVVGAVNIYQDCNIGKKGGQLESLILELISLRSWE